PRSRCSSPEPSARSRTSPSPRAERQAAPMHALITGGSSGIGAATAQVLHREAWRVTDLSRRSGVDVSIRDQLDKALDEAPRPDALIYSAGHVEVGPLAQVSDAEWDYQVEVNLTAAF